jgi:hypothetical protein
MSKGIARWNAREKVYPKVCKILDFWKYGTANRKIKAAEHRSQHNLKDAMGLSENLNSNVNCDRHPKRMDREDNLAVG